MEWKQHTKLGGRSRSRQRSGRSVPGLPACLARPEMEFVNAAANPASIDVVWVSTDGSPPETIISGLAPGESDTLLTTEGHRFRASSFGDSSCREEFVVTAAASESGRHEFCAYSKTPPAHRGLGTALTGDGHQANDEL